MATRTQTTKTTNGAPLTGAPACPKCGGRMWDNRQDKRNPKAPDFRCRDRSCGGALWPGQHKAAAQIIVPRAVPQDSAPDSGTRQAAGQSDHSSSGGDGGGHASSNALRRCYLDVIDFVLAAVRPTYERAGVPCTGETLAAIAATLFIATCRKGRGGDA